MRSSPYSEAATAVFCLQSLLNYIFYMRFYQSFLQAPLHLQTQDKEKQPLGLASSMTVQLSSEGDVMKKAFSFNKVLFPHV